MSTGTICLLISAGIMIIVTIYLDIVGEYAAEIKEIAEEQGWADRPAKSSRSMRGAGYMDNPMSWLTVTAAVAYLIGCLLRQAACEIEERHAASERAWKEEGL